MPTYTYPEGATLREIAQILLPRLTRDRLGFQIMPLRNDDSDILMWEQKDNYTGLQQLRGLNGEPVKVTRVGGKRYLSEPGAYGEFELIDERELTKRRPWGGFAGSISIDDLVMELQEQLLGRELDRQEWIIWTLLTTGTFSVARLEGGIQHTDTYSIQAYTGSDWSAPTTATPLADLRAIALLAAGKSVNLGAGAMAVMNRITFNYFFSNTNANDFGGMKGPNQSRIVGMDEVQEILVRADAPTIVVYDQGYLNDSGTFTRYIPNRKVVIVGQRADGAEVGEYRLTRNANNPDLGPGSYDKIVDNGEDEVPREIVVHRGHNGGPVIFFPSAVVVASV